MALDCLNQGVISSAFAQKSVMARVVTSSELILRIQIALLNCQRTWRGIDIHTNSHLKSNHFA